ncbi:hypothetical protein [Kitasatospora camelliae]|uniref:Uncharacterized protein n=1 Tax=Kitasatospora camelliae TaxID=3156397 RepID=A0AAU8JT95_9ACTN
MVEQQPRPCPACGGQQGTEKTRHSVDLDADGRQVHRQHTYWSPCTTCGGTGLSL